ncbi:MAG: hypothetical protein ACLTSX_09670 [Collinsella sp.]
MTCMTRASELLNVFDAAREVGNEDRVIAFASTSKITFPVLAWVLLPPLPWSSRRSCTICRPVLSAPTKLNQLRHVRFLPDLDADARPYASSCRVHAPALRVRGCQAA